MKRLLLPAIAVVLVLTACGAGHRSASQATTRGAGLELVSAVTTRLQAEHEAEQIVDAFVPPPGAAQRDNATEGRRPLFRDAGRGIYGKRIDRHRVRLVHGSVGSVEAFLQSHPPRGWGSPSIVSTGGKHGDVNTDLTYAVPGFGGRSTGRLLNVAAVRARDGALLRVDAVVVWNLPRSTREDLPAGVRAIRVHGPHVAAQVTDPAQVRTIVRWFDRLELVEPRFIPACPFMLQPSFEFVFEDARGAALARASVPELSGICSAITYSIRGHEKDSLIGGDFVGRVQRLIDANWIGPQDVAGVAAEREHVAERKAEKLIGRVVLPAGARRARAPEALRHANLGVSVLTEFAYRHRVWRVREPLSSVVAFMKSHRLRGFEPGVSGDSPESLGFDEPPAGGHPMQRQLDLEFAARGGWTYLRADAGVAWIYPRSPREVVPPGVREIDIAGAGAKRDVTDSAQVTTIVRWFDALNVAPPGSQEVMCAPELSSPVSFVFRAATGVDLAHAVVPSESADGCSPIELSIRSKRQTPLIDARFGRYAFVSRVQRLLGVCFRDPRRACR